MGMSARAEALYTYELKGLRMGGIPSKTLSAQGRPKSSMLKGNVELIERIMDEDRRVTIRELEERVGIRKTTMNRIIREDLEMSRVVAMDAKTSI